MPAPSADFPALSASTSSSGYSDGLGRRALAFDREDGTMLERLVVRAELSAFERSLRERVERIAAMDDERLAKPRSIDWTHDGSLVVLSEFVPGSRLSDLLDATEQHGTVPGVDVAIGFLLDVLPALCGLHAGAGFAHGAISAGRTVLTPAGQVVLLDGIFGDALSRLQYSRRRLWNEFGVAMPPAAGRPRFDASCDIAQVALSAVMLVLGRPIAAYEYPDSIPSLLVEVVDVAQIRGSTEFAAGLQRFLQRSLPLPSRRPYSAADDALIDVRDLARSLGLDGCRRALVEFIEQQQEADHHSTALDRLDEESDLSTAYSYSYGSDEPSEGSNGHGLDDLAADPEDPPLEVDLDLDAHAEHEDAAIYDLNTGVSYTLDEPEQVDQIAYDPEPREEAHVDPAPFEAAVLAPAPVPPEEPVVEAEPFVAPEPVVQAVAPPEPEPEPAPVPELVAAATEALPVPPPAIEPPVREPEVTTQPAEAEPAAIAETEDDVEHDASAPGADDEPVEDSRSSRRRKRSRSARSRKDKLRSVARPQPLIPPPAPPAPAPRAQSGPPPKAKGSGWLVEPSRAAAFEPGAPVQPPPPAPPPAPVEAPKLAPPIAVAPPPPPLPPPPPPPMVHAVAPPPPPPPQMPRPIVPPPPMAPIALQRPPMPTPISAPPPPPAAGPQAGSGPLPALKLKNEPPAGYAPKRPRPETEDVYGGRPILTAAESTSSFPWKLASAALGLMVVAVVAGRAYLTDSTPTEPPVAAPVEASAPAQPVEPAPAAAAKTGRVQVTTQPPGAKVLLDGKHVGDSPLTLEVPAGRHTITMAASSGLVRRTIRVDAGKTVIVDAPIFSGWVDVVAPIILDVIEDGKSIGTTEQSRLLLRPGRHELTFSNRDLDYSSTHTIDIEPGEVQTLNLDPRGTANLNATPWAEVWLNGKKIGDTPLANLRLPLGTHEVIFKHPDHGERRVTTTIRANAPVAVSVDMRKP